jgi:hypothetical protein
MNRTAVLYALASAALFGASTPAAKALLGSIEPAVLAGLLYCGAGIGIAILRLLALSAIASFGRAKKHCGEAIGLGWPGLSLPVALSDLCC